MHPRTAPETATAMPVLDISIPKAGAASGSDYCTRCDTTADRALSVPLLLMDVIAK